MYGGSGGTPPPPKKKKKLWKLENDTFESLKNKRFENICRMVKKSFWQLGRTRKHPKDRKTENGKAEKKKFHGKPEIDHR